MTATDLRDEIGRALRAVWPEFEAREPVLALLFDHNMVLDAAAERFADDPDYQHMLADASAKGASYQEMAMLVGKLTKYWLLSISQGAITARRG